MMQARQGSTVTINYIGTLDNGRIFHSTEEDGALVISIGADQVFPALEQALIGMRAGEVKNVVLSAEEAYGLRSLENIITLSRQSFPASKEISVGQKVSIAFKGGIEKIMRVSAVSDSDVTLDGNHPLAGCELTFALKVERIE